MKTQCSRTSGGPAFPGMEYEDLHESKGLRELLRRFERELHNTAPESHERYRRYRESGGTNWPQREVSELLLELAPRVGDFVARLFGVVDWRERQIQRCRDEIDVVFAFRAAVGVKLAQRFQGQDLDNWNLRVMQGRLDRLLKLLAPEEADGNLEYAVCRAGMALVRMREGSGAQAIRLRENMQQDNRTRELFAQALAIEGHEAFASALLECIERWCWMGLQRSGAFAANVRGWQCLRMPRRMEFHALVDHEIEQKPGYACWAAPPGTRRRRDGFRLTDRRGSLREILYETEHCIYCHERGTDSCSHGMRARKGSGFRKNPLDIALTGCPLEEKVSEMNLLKRRGDNIAALALVTLDNPMCPGTGHRICNDCMKACIYQKKDPVNVPQIETRVLTDVLSMPYGFEIYSLLTRWNPLNPKRPYALPYNGKNVLVVGMGPAGYTLAHYLLNEGFGVVGVDALKIEPLPADLTGTNGKGMRPVREFAELYEELDRRATGGFGGVAEYGITVRWDKNFLKIIYLNLVRRGNFRCYDGVRFGGTLTADDAWALGFDHVAMACGAGKPAILGLRNNLIQGIRKASDFLMALQLTGASREDTLANLLMRLPVGVIGGGLTAIDTATEALAYYPVQVEKILLRYETLGEERQESELRAAFDERELAFLDEFLAHARALREERRHAAEEKREPDIAGLLDRWGGVTLFYRRRMEESPAYRQNHEEVSEALREGVRVAECLGPVEALADEHGALCAVRFERREKRDDGKWVGTGEHVEVPLNGLFIAAGMSPNTIYEQEIPYTFRMCGDAFQRYEPEWNGESNGPRLIPMDDDPVPKAAKPAPFTSYCRNGKYITFFGDNHPVYAGSVVKAMASARDGYPYIVQLFRDDLSALDPARQEQRDAHLRQWFETLDKDLRASVTEVRRLSPNIVEIVAQAPMQARKFQPGQFYRVQNYEAYAPRIGDTVLASEGLALTGASVDRKRGLISLIALEMGSSSRLCSLWRPGDPLVVMGVTGSPTHIPAGHTVMLAGGGLGNAVQFSIGRALRAAGSRVLYFAGFRKREDVFKMEEMEQASDVIVWTVDNGPPVSARRPGDKTTTGNIVQAMVAYARGGLGKVAIPMEDVDHVIVIGSDRMMAAVKRVRHEALQPYLKPGHTAIGSINSPMQCMMKGVCGQCLCRHVDPKTGEEYFVFSCYNQDQGLDRVDFRHLDARLRQNSTQEKLSSLWLDRLLRPGRHAKDCFTGKFALF